MPGKITTVDLATNPYFGAQDQGDGSGTMGNGDGSGFFNFEKAGLKDAPKYDAGDPISGGGDSKYKDRLQQYLADNNYSLKTQSDTAGDFRWVEDANGKIIGDKQFFSAQEEGWDLAAGTMLAFAGGPLGIGNTIGSSLGLTGKLAATVGGGVLNAGHTAAMGGDPRAALLSTALSAGGSLLDKFGGSLGLNLPEPLQKGLVGGITSAAKGGDFLSGAASSALLPSAGSLLDTGNPMINNLLKAIVGPTLQQKTRGGKP